MPSPALCHRLALLFCILMFTLLMPSRGTMQTGILLLSSSSSASFLALPEASSSASGALSSASGSETSASSSSAFTGSSASSRAGSDFVTISEVLPDPIGSDDAEWLELANNHSVPLFLSGCTLRKIGSSTLYTLPPVTMEPETYRVFPKTETKLPLVNAGAEIALVCAGIEHDRLVYPALEENISYGPDGDGALRSWCTPTPGAVNADDPFTISTELQSGSFEGEGSVSANIQVLVFGRDAGSVTCHIDFDDGTQEDSCNPPSHTWTVPGRHTMRIRVTDACGTTVLREQDVIVTEAPISSSPSQPPSPSKPSLPASSSSSFQSSSSSCVATEILPVSITGAMPNPSGSDAQEEWIELVNKGSATIDLCGWLLDDREGGSTPFPLTGMTLASGTTLRLRSAQTGIGLNNDGDEVRLIRPSGAVHFILSFKGVSENQIVTNEMIEKNEEQSTASGIVHLSTGVILISEVFPSPVAGSGDDEWIELQNSGEDIVDLSGWQIDDETGKGSKAWEIPEGTVIAASSFLVFRKSETKLSLTNGGDRVALLRPDGSVSDEIVFGTIKNGFSYARSDGSWCITSTPSPLAQNVCEAIQKTAKRTTVASTSSPLSFVKMKYENIIPDVQEEETATGEVLPPMLAQLGALQMSTPPVQESRSPSGLMIFVLALLGGFLGGAFGGSIQKGLYFFPHLFHAEKV